MTMLPQQSQPEYYILTPVYPPKPGKFVIENASVGHCGLCGRVTAGMGGSDNQICVPCADVVMSKQAVGAIKWGEKADDTTA